MRRPLGVFTSAAGPGNGGSCMSENHDLRELMDELGIAVDITNGPEPATRDGWDHNLYRFSITVRGEHILSNAPYMAGMGLDSTTATDVFGAVIMDLQCVEPYDSDAGGLWAEWADDLGLVTDAKTAVKAQRDFREIMARRSLLIERL